MVIPQDDREWDFGFSAASEVSLNIGELLLVDWVLVPGSGLVSILHDLSEAMVWNAMRAEVWKQASLIHAELEATKEDPARKRIAQYTVKPLVMSEEDAQILLAHVPTTFRWDGATDVGFILKLKLAAYLRGEKYETPVPPKPAPAQPGEYDD